jgi:acetylornithine deacetylase/succinyl-diaminopimelate desuccinylase-like protein
MVGGNTVSVPKAAIDRAHSRKEIHLSEYMELLSIPSVSTLSEHKHDILRAAEWVAGQLRKAKMSRVEIIPTSGHPVVYGEWLGAPGKPTVLVYGHYDVQPVDPLNEWTTGPFEPTIRGEDIYARGASDMKGQILAQIQAVQCLHEAGPLPINIKYMIEGEEEIGSPNLDTFIDTHKELLKCDVVLNCDAGIHAPDLPAITYGLRGLAYFEVEVHGPATDLHSGLFGGTIANPCQVLCELIAGMHDADGRVTLPGFYDKVRKLTDEERVEIAKVPYSDEHWKQMTGSKELCGEKGFTTIERRGCRPTLEVNGIVGGFTGEGQKTVLPAKAVAKISTRLVPDQDSSEIGRQLTAYLEQHAPKTVTWSVKAYSNAQPGVMERNTTSMLAAVNALKEVFGVEPVFKREGGTVPVVSMLQKKLGVDSIMLGFALPSDGIHGPNEKQHLPNYFKGIETYIRFLSQLS